MRIILFGTGPFAVPSFKAILRSNHKVVALVTRPILDSGKRRKTSENPARELAEQYRLPIHHPVNVNEADFVAVLRSLHADLFVVCDYGQILSQDCLATARLGGINLHGSLLPKYRGAAPIHWAIYHGETTTGVTIIHMTTQLDGGPCLASAMLEIKPLETTEEVEPRLSQLGVQPVLDSLAMLEAWDGHSPLGTVQDRKLATKAPRLKKTDGHIQWSRSANEIVNQIRAFQPWPGSYSFWPREHSTEPERLIITLGRVVTESEAQVHSEVGIAEPRPGQVIFNDGHQLWIQSGQGWVNLLKVQPSGKRVMPIGEFLRGHRLPVGTQFS
jgi:methionyl-tRNA formyltransferase